MKVTIIIDKPFDTKLPAVISDMFERSLAISEAVSKFWDMDLAESAELGDVIEGDNSWYVGINY